MFHNCVVHHLCLRSLLVWHWVSSVLWTKNEDTSDTNTFQLMTQFNIYYIIHWRMFARCWFKSKLTVDWNAEFIIHLFPSSNSLLARMWRAANMMAVLVMRGWESRHFLVRSKDWMKLWFHVEKIRFLGEMILYHPYHLSNKRMINKIFHSDLQIQLKKNWKSRKKILFVILLLKMDRDDVES